MSEGRHIIKREDGHHLLILQNRDRFHYELTHQDADDNEVEVEYLSYDVEDMEDWDFEVYEAIIEAWKKGGNLDMSIEADYCARCEA